VIIRFWVIKHSIKTLMHIFAYEIIGFEPNWLSLHKP